jgi:hypothetical protein
MTSERCEQSPESSLASGSSPFTIGLESIAPIVSRYFAHVLAAASFAGIRWDVSKGTTLSDRVEKEGPQPLSKVLDCAIQFAQIQNSFAWASTASSA